MTNWLSKSTKATPLAGTTFEKVDDYTITMTLPTAYSGIEYFIKNADVFREPD